MKCKLIFTDFVFIARIGNAGVFICFYPSVGTVRLFFQKSQTTSFRLFHCYGLASLHVRTRMLQTESNNHISSRIPVKVKINAFVFTKLICIHLVPCRIVFISSPYTLRSIGFAKQAKFFFPTFIFRDFNIFLAGGLVITPHRLAYISIACPSRPYNRRVFRYGNRSSGGGFRRPRFTSAEYESKRYDDTHSCFFHHSDRTFPFRMCLIRMIPSQARENHRLVIWRSPLSI